MPLVPLALTRRRYRYRQTAKERVSGTGSHGGDPFFVMFYVHDGILVEVHSFQDGRRLRRATEPSRRITLGCSSLAVHGIPPFWKRIRF